MSVSGNERYWLGEADRVKRHINVAWWVERFNWLLVSGVLSLSAVLLWKRTEADFVLSVEILLIVSGVVVFLSGAGAWVWSRQFFIGRKEALIRLDDRLSLNSQLISASARRGAWPDQNVVAGESDAMPPWHLKVAIFPPLTAALVLGTAWLIPIPEPQAGPSIVTVEPKSWDQVEEWIETLAAEDLIEPESLDEIADKIEELRQKPESEWFSHSSLEASDTLKDSVGRDLLEMANDFAALERSLDALTTFSEDLSEEGKEMLMKELTEAMESLASNGLSLNEELAEQLNGIDPSRLSEGTLSQMSPQDMESLQQQLSEASQSLGAMEGLPEPGEGEGMLSYQPGLMPGSGGSSRGEGDAPIFFGDPADLKTNQVESVSNEDLSRAALGDLIGVGETEHGEEISGSGPQAGGAVESVGSGGDAVWKDSLLPGEQAVLKRYFK
ncbi:MAG: hypothetical protein P1U68_07930 [Verrucomicrobiales bacterium]|nr:hypothetical protein [Verrucomicrobiales bacterium]